MPTICEKAIDHIVYEYANLVSAGELLKKQHEPPTINTHVQDAFLLSCRKMADFFTKKPERDDVCSLHYISGQQSRLPEWEKWKVAIDKQLAHITFERVKKPKPWHGTKTNPVLLEEFRNAWKRLLSRMDPDVHKLFEAQISARKRAPGFESLDLH